MKSNDLSWDELFKRTEDLNDSDPISWLSLAVQITQKDLIGVRLFGMFDDLENGVTVYEPAEFAQAHGDWSSR